MALRLSKKRKLPEKLLTKHVKIGSHDLEISICKLYLIHDLIIECDDRDFLDILVSNYKTTSGIDLTSSVVRDGIYGKPILVFDTSDEYDYLKERMDSLIEFLYTLEV